MTVIIDISGLSQSPTKLKICVIDYISIVLKMVQFFPK